jgi:Predicted Zn-dependent protease (DUF2268)
MPAAIRIRDHISPLLGIDDTAFAEYVKRLKRRVSRSNPQAVLTRRTIGDDRLLATVPARAEAVPSLEFVIAHEYSHTHYDYDVDAETVRGFLVSEGLAMVLAETFASKPQPYPWDQVTSEQEAEFWEQVDPAARGLNAYMTYMGSEASYVAGARVVRSYLRRHKFSIAEAHSRSLEELY